MATRNPQRTLRANPSLTAKLRVTLAIAAEEMATNEVAITEAMRDPRVRANLRLFIHAAAELLAEIHTKSVEPQFAARRAAAQKARH